MAKMVRPNASAEETGMGPEGDDGQRDGVGDDDLQYTGDQTQNNSDDSNTQPKSPDVQNAVDRASDEELEGARQMSIEAQSTSSLASKKRKSDEIAQGPGRPPSTSSASSTVQDTANNAGADSVAGLPKNMGSPEGNKTRYSPLSPQGRARGMSLRSSLFARNMNRSHDHALEMEQVESSDGASDQPTTPPKDGKASGSVSHMLRKVSTPDKKGLQGISVLPNYQQWAQKRANKHLPIQRIKETYRRITKFVLRIQEIPPSQDGRHVPVDASRNEPLIDDRTGKPYIDNFIKSSKYNAWNFLPRQLFAQFSKLANSYFLFVSILQMIPGLSTTGTYTTIVPLMFFVSLSMGKEGFEDLRRHRLDKAENNREARVLQAYKSGAEDGADEAFDDGPIHWNTAKWQDLRVGDIIKLERDESAPADLMMLDSKGENSMAYIETMALDGETNLKTKQPSPALGQTCSTPAGIISLGETEVVVEDPNLDLYKFDGKISVNGEAFAPLTNNEIIYRGSVLRNTPEAIGVVVYSGEECKIRMNANKNPRIKAPTLQTIVNKIVLMMVLFVITLSLFNSMAYKLWQDRTEDESWYLIDAPVPFGHVLTSFIIMFNTLIPLSLYVSLEIVKVAQMYLLNDIDMYDEASDTPFEARTSTINEELGQVSYVFSDKTGTLTENVMRFRKLSVAGTAWLHEEDLRKESTEEEMLMHKKRKVKATEKHPRKSASGISRDASTSNPPRKSTATWRSGAAPNKEQPELSTKGLVRYIQRHPHTNFAKKANMVILSMAVCHTCLPERGENEEEINYQAASPDELALVQAARELGYIAWDRQLSTLTLKTLPKGPNREAVFEAYEILDVIEFSSKRKRMSVIVRFPDNRIYVICKGADSVIMERLRLANLARQKAAEVETRVNERRSVEAEHALRRKSSAIEQSGSGVRASMSPRASMGRPSFGRLGSIQDNVDGWLAERESDGASPRNTNHYSPRPSAQLARKSTAGSLQTQLEDDVVVDESLVSDDGAVIERCFQHINDFATEGLRTLLYGYRSLDEEEYRSWKKIFTNATTSLVDREELIEQAGEQIEQKLELGGATAIEDKLQKGVPETIDRLRRANIKMWMLTGDKRETAINIGHSCRLIKDFSSVTVLDYEAGGVEQSIAAAIVSINNGNVAHAVIIIDGRTLGMIEAEESMHTLFLDLAILADSVVCCRASPSQKAGLVHAIRRRVNRSVTLAIGDGANDIAMIQEAHVGIGITGKEGLQAARVSDYSIAQFRFLNKLLLVHGRWNYIRTAKYTVGTFWKEMVFYLTQALYQRWNGYTGTSLYEQWSLSMFNTLFTSLPVIFLGIFEKDLSASTLLAVPELYTKGQRGAAFNFRVYAAWMAVAASEAMVVFFTMKGLFGEAVFTNGKDLFAMGVLTYSVCVILINTKLQLLEQHNLSIMALICMIVEVGGWFLWNILLSVSYSDTDGYRVEDTFLDRFGRNALWWLALVLGTASCILFELALRALKCAFFPTDVETFQQLEKDLPTRRRFEEASASELQAGWRHGDTKSSGELEREREVQELLERRVEDGGGGPEVEVKGGGGGGDVHEMLSRRFGRVIR